MSHTPPGRTRERVWTFVRDRLLGGDPPTVRDVQRALGFRAVESARAHLEALVEAGLLEKEPGATRDGRSRGYRLAGAASPSAGGRTAFVPVLGRVQAGALTTAVEEAEGAVAVQSRHSPRDMFALRVRGDSMRGAGILDGDLVIVRRQETAEDGRIVVALVGDEATVKRLRLVRSPGCAHGAPPRVELHPENPDFPVICPPPGDVRLLGRVVEVRRHLDSSAPPWETGGVPWFRGSVDPSVSPGIDPAADAVTTSPSRSPSREPSRKLFREPSVHGTRGDEASHEERPSDTPPGGASPSGEGSATARRGLRRK